MPMHDDFDPAHPLPVFLDDQYEQQGIGTVRDRAGTWSRVLKASILIATAAVIGVAALSGNPVALVADVTASLVDNLGLQPATAPSTPTIQAAVDTLASPPPAQEQAVPLAAQDTPARSEVAAAVSGRDGPEQAEPFQGLFLGPGCGIVEPFADRERGRPPHLVEPKRAGGQGAMEGEVSGGADRSDQLVDLRTQRRVGEGCGREGEREGRHQLGPASHGAEFEVNRQTVQ